MRPGIVADRSRSTRSNPDLFAKPGEKIGQSILLIDRPGAADLLGGRSSVTCATRRITSVRGSFGICSNAEIKAMLFSQPSCSVAGTPMSVTEVEEPVGNRLR